MEQLKNGMERVTVMQAAKELNMTWETVQELLKRERLPIGFAVKREGKKRYTYYIYRGLLDQYKAKIIGQ